jgi:hypothetical protein
MSSPDFDNDVYIYDYKFRFIFNVYLRHEDKNIKVNDSNIDLVFEWYKERFNELYDILKDNIGPFEYKLSTLDNCIVIDGKTNQNSEESYYIKAYLVDIDDDGNDPLIIDNKQYIVIPMQNKYGKLIKESHIKISE